MTDAEKASAFDLLAEALLNRWWDGRWSWHCLTPSGGPQRDTREEALADLVRWSETVARKRRTVPLATAETAH